MARHQQSEGLPPEACNVIVAGDFNEESHGGVAHLLANGWAPLVGAASSGTSLADAPTEVTQPYLLQVGTCLLVASHHPKENTSCKYILARGGVLVSNDHDVLVHVHLISWMCMSAALSVRIQRVSFQSADVSTASKRS